MKVLIIGSGDFCCPSDFMERCVIACDGGLDHCMQNGIEPDYILGDFDSVSKGGLEFFKNKEKTVYPVKKDKTDIELGFDLAFELGADDITITGALSGTRLDHTLCNIELLKLCADKNIPARAINNNNEIMLLKGGQTLSVKNTGRYVSVLPLCEKIDGLTLDGFEYPLKDHDLHIGSSLCISNRAIGDNGIITIKNGIAAIICAKD